MRSLSNLGVIAAIALAGCAQQPTLSVSDYSQPTAELRDTVENHDGYKADMYYVAKIDEAAVKNAASIAIAGSYGRGFKMPQAFDFPRTIPVRQVTLLLRAQVVTGAPIHAIAGQVTGAFRAAERRVVFVPKADGRYIVKGTLVAPQADVWLEDASTGERFK